MTGQTAHASATLGGGCFWCLEAVYQEVEGVVHVESGYAGGHVDNPSYQQVCEGSTGHAEVVRIEFDPARISYRSLLAIFFAIHDPTTLNRQGNDVGTQYRSVVFYHDDQQRQAVESVIAELVAEGVYARPIVTQVAPLTNYFVAEAHHQNYYRQNPYQGYCAYVISPKLAKFRKRFFGT